MQRAQSTIKKRGQRKRAKGYEVAAAADALGMNKKERKRAQRKWRSRWNAWKPRWNAFTLRDGRLSWCQKMGYCFFMVAVVLGLCQWLMAQAPIADIKVIPFGPVLVHDADDADVESAGLLKNAANPSGTETAQIQMQRFKRLSDEQLGEQGPIHRDQSTGADLVMSNEKGMDQYTTFYTISRNDRFGAQYIAMAGCLAFCHNPENNCKYIHTPFGIALHREGTQNGFVSTQFIGIPVVSEQELSKVGDRLQKVSNCPSVPYNSRPSSIYTPGVLKIIRDHYNSSPKPVIQEPVAIAVHIRNGDNPGQSPPLSKVARLLKKVMARYPEHAKQGVRVISQGKPSDFELLTSEIPGLHLELDTDMTEAFHTMVRAQVLVPTSKSTFGWMPAYLNENVVIVSDELKQWPPLDHWTRIE